jgi:hypothetical protein
MFKPKTPISGRLENSSGAQIRTEDLRVMSSNPTPAHFFGKYVCFWILTDLWFLVTRQTVVGFPRI